MIVLTVLGPYSSLMDVLEDRVCNYPVLNYMYEVLGLVMMIYQSNSTRCNDISDTMLY